jgi:hypothetical protein
MSVNDRSELFAVLAALAQRYPHWRLGQLVANVAGWADVELWDAEDDQLLSAARAHLASLSDRNGGQPSPNQSLHLTGRE